MSEQAVSAAAPDPSPADRAAAYLQFLRQKIKLASFDGFDVPLEQINPALKPHVRDIVRWSIKGGNRAVFASFGLHKTSEQLEWHRLIGARHADAYRLQVVPLGVRHEFFREARERFTGEYAIDLRFIRRDSEIDDPRTIYLTNYEAVREGNITPARFRAASLDEASVLRSFGSKTYQELLPAFAGVEFKQVATATPDPNRYKELIHYAGYLGVMDTGQALTRFFQRDSEKAGNLTLYPHKEQEFWLWVASWAVFITKPSDLGHSDDGYVLPPLQVRWHEIPSDYATAGADKDGQGRLVHNTSMSLPAAAAEKRNSMAARVAKVQEIVEADPQDHFIIWHDLEDERHALQEAIPEAVSVWGSQDLDEREQRIVDFSDGKHRILSTKPIIAGSGCNFQRHCHREVFAGITDKFNDFIQAIHRTFRFGASLTVPVVIDIIHTEAERERRANLEAKWRRHDAQQQRMAELVRTYGLDQLAMHDTLARTMLKDSTKMGTGCSEYLLVFRKPQSDRARGYADEPVMKERDDYSLARWQVDAHNYWRSSGNRLMTADEMARLGPGKLAKFFTDESLRSVYDYERHVEIGEQLLAREALPKLFACLEPGSPDPSVWTDINRMRTLNEKQASRAVEKHVCPLQLDIVNRAIERWSSRGELVYDPFHGIGTVGACAIEKGRRAGGSELAATYFADQVHYLRAAERKVSMPTLFDALEPEPEAA